MENRNTAPKIKNEEFKIAEIISATSGRTVRGVDYVDNYDKIANALRNSSDYKYDDKKSLVELLLQYFNSSNSKLIGYKNRGKPLHFNIFSLFPKNKVFK